MLTLSVASTEAATKVAYTRPRLVALDRAPRADGFWDRDDVPGAAKRRAAARGRGREAVLGLPACLIAERGPWDLVPGPDEELWDVRLRVKGRSPRPNASHDVVPLDAIAQFACQVDRGCALV